MSAIAESTTRWLCNVMHFPKAMRYYSMGIPEERLDNFLIVDNSLKDEIIIPSIALMNTLTVLIDNPDVPIIAIPLYEGKRVKVANFTSALKDEYINRMYNYKLTRIKENSNNENYYVGGGAIFNKDFNPLLLHSFKFKKTGKVLNYDTGSVPYKMVESIIYMSNQVLLHPDIPLHKSLKRLLPHIPAISLNHRDTGPQQLDYYKRMGVDFDNIFHVNFSSLIIGDINNKVYHNNNRNLMLSDIGSIDGKLNDFINVHSDIVVDNIL